jgi:hypothetical protein
MGCVDGAWRIQNCSQRVGPLTSPGGLYLIGVNTKLDVNPLERSFSTEQGSPLEKGPFAIAAPHTLPIFAGYTVLLPGVNNYIRQRPSTIARSVR